MNLKEALEYKGILQIGTEKGPKDIAEYVEESGIYKCYSDEKHIARFFDDSSGNFHLMPKDKKILNACQQEITEKRDKIFVLLNQYTEGKIEWKLKDKRTGNGKKQYHSLYNYLRIEVKNRKYDLMFFRMAINKEIKEVKCIIKSVQFAFSLDAASCDMYPELLDDQENIESIWEKENKAQYYFNPKVAFEDDMAIVKNFIEYIETNEKRF